MATSGSRPEWLKKIESKLECPVCFKTILDPPVYVCVNQHMLCEDCHDELKQRNQKCPQCRGDFNGKRNLGIESILESIPTTKCKYEGCNFAKADTVKVKKHEDGCKHRLVKCHICDRYTTVLDLAHHQVSVHKSNDGIERPLGVTGRHFRCPRVRIGAESLPIEVKGGKDGLKMFFNMFPLEGHRQLMWISHNQAKDDTENYKFTIALLCDKAHDKGAKKRIAMFSGYCYPSDVSLDTIKEEVLGLNLSVEFLKKYVDKEDRALIELRLEKSKEVDNMTQ